MTLLEPNYTRTLPMVALLALGAVVVLLFVRPLSTRPGLAAVLGTLCTTGVAAMALATPGLRGVQAAVPLGVVATIAVWLVPSLELERPEHHAESTALLLLATAGGLALASAQDLLQVVVGLETLALSAVTLVALARADEPLEAAFKYFVLGAVSLAALLYGVGLVYLGTGSFAFPTLDQLASSPLVLAGTVLVALGIVFELAVFPFHWGGLDAYTAAAPGIAGYVMSASKLAAAFALGRVALAAGPPVGQVLVWVGCLTILWGTFGAIAQRDLRRLLAYSAVTHAGFIALALGSGTEGPATATFYATVYGATAMLVFAGLAGHGLGRHALDGPGLRGLGAGRVAALALGLLSLSGIPPTPGFWAKLAVLSVAWQAAGPLAALVAAMGGVVSVLYYLRPLPDLFAVLRASPPTAGRAAAGPAIAVAAALVVALGVFPPLAWNLTR